VLARGQWLPRAALPWQHLAGAPLTTGQSGPEFFYY